MEQENNSNDSGSIFDDSDADPNYETSDSSSSSENNVQVRFNGICSIFTKNMLTVVDNMFFLHMCLENTLNMLFWLIQEVVACKGRKRLRRESTQKKNKILKDSGQKYQTYRGKGCEKEARKPGEPCSCSLKCFERIPVDIQQNIFTRFWNYADYNIQNTYLRGCLKKQSVKRKTKQVDSRRTGTIEYSIDYNAVVYVVCKSAFISIHGLGRGRVEHLVKKIKDGTTSSVDNRGKHCSHKKKYTENDIKNVRQFIEMLPTYESHYSRNKSPHKKYLGLEYNIQSLYEEYKNNCSVNNTTAVSGDKFRRLFTEEFNISFKSPKCDTCAKCDELAVSIAQAKNNGNEAELRTLLTQKDIHLRKAEAARQMLNEAIQASKNNNKIHVITFDLQQALPTPKLTTGPCFYKKKLWCYNFSIHRCGSSDRGYFYFWDEATAKRGSDEITSCLKKYFDTNDIKGDTLYLVSDNCGGQNKNWTVVGFWLYLLFVTKRFKKIIHIFPQVGHTMLPSDRDFALVEKCARKRAAIYSPDEWAEVLKNSQKKNPFVVTRMQREDFYNMSEIRGCFKQSNKTLDNQNFGISSCVKLELNAEKPFILSASESYNGPLKEVSLRKRGRPNAIEELDISLEQKYTEGLPIDESKLTHVMSCLQWIPPVHHAYYYSLRSAD